MMLSCVETTPRDPTVTSGLILGVFFIWKHLKSWTRPGDGKPIFVLWIIIRNTSTGFTGSSQKCRFYG